MSQNVKIKKQTKKDEIANFAERRMAYGKYGAGYEGIAGHYSSSVEYGISITFNNYFWLKTFEPWW